MQSGGASTNKLNRRPAHRGLSGNIPGKQPLITTKWGSFSTLSPVSANRGPNNINNIKAGARGTNYSRVIKDKLSNPKICSRAEKPKLNQKLISDYWKARASGPIHNLSSEEKSDF